MNIRFMIKVHNRLPFYHRRICSLLNERSLQSKYYSTFFLVPPDLYDTEVAGDVISDMDVDGGLPGTYRCGLLAWAIFEKIEINHSCNS